MLTVCISPRLVTSYSIHKLIIQVGGRNFSPLSQTENLSIKLFCGIEAVDSILEYFVCSEGHELSKLVVPQVA